jgi:GMP synthase (glutamine-hydrolysing)
MRPVLLFQLGEAPDPVRAIHGPFASWYERAYAASLVTHDGRWSRPLPDPRDFAGVLVTGSASSLVRREPWMEDAAAFVVDCHDAGVPVLGVCFGHQLIGAAFGGAVVTNPRGWEVGTVSVEIDVEDPLFHGLPSTLRVNMVHEDMIAADGLPARVQRLGGNAHTPLGVVAVGDHIRGVQFHPEVTGPIVRSYIDARRARLMGLDPDALMSEADDSPHAIAVLRNFRERFVEKS